VHVVEGVADVPAAVLKLVDAAGGCNE